MRYQPITESEYFSNRKFIGKRWTRKQIRAIQAILNVTHGQVGRGYSFFQAAFGRTEEEYFEILRLPDSYIKRRWDAEITGALQAWRDDYQALTQEEKKIADEYVAIDGLRENREIINGLSTRLAKYLSHYLISFEDVKPAPAAEKKQRVKEFNELCKVEISSLTKELVKKAEVG